MNIKRPVLLFLIQITVVLSIAGKYLYERKTSPRVWIKSAPYDPNLPLRGRYLLLQLEADGCALPHDEKHHIRGYVGADPPDPGYWRWRVIPVSRDGKLVVGLARDGERSESEDQLTQWSNRTCDRAVLASSVDYFIPDTARTPFPLQKGRDLWVEVTVPPAGPPRPIQLATSQNGVFTPLKF